MDRELVRIYDTSLRDGLRNSGVTMMPEQKLRFAAQLERLRVDAVEVGYGGPSQIDTMRGLAAALSGPVVYGLSRVNVKDVQRVLTGVERAKKPGVNIFSPVSDEFLRKAKKSRAQAIADSAAAVAYARRHVDHVTFSAQDASRADPAYLAEILRAAVDAGATAVSIADTVSYAVPSQFGRLCASLGERLAATPAVTLSVHCHNGIGLAVANSLAGVENGARQVECTVNGIGEGEGNTPLQAVVNALRVRNDVFTSVRTGIAGEHLSETGQLLADFAPREREVN